VAQAEEVMPRPVAEEVLEEFPDWGAWAVEDPAAAAKAAAVVGVVAVLVAAAAAAVIKVSVTA